MRTTSTFDLKGSMDGNESTNNNVTTTIRVDSNTDSGSDYGEKRESIAMRGKEAFSTLKSKVDLAAAVR